MGGATQKQSIILRLKWTWNYCHTIWLRLLEKLNAVEMDEYTAGVVSCFCRHQQLQFQVILAQKTPLNLLLMLVLFVGYLFIYFFLTF